ncbi:hypothetical protein LGQ02_14790 [Bacillus shivajii]|uniref:ATP-grasp domain-containing protein n=1 Tax=Bacillus shivajii TaxID=1983719 RepID=UPI001CFA4258|nr:hypothetical protein [Bacillus shivajii]UCZ52106.1 hypothetical protein LGQ02_14790 [Bacillus shivajii]
MKKKHGLLIYREEDINRNEKFISLLIKASHNVHRPLTLISYEQLLIQVSGSSEFFTRAEMPLPAFIINRSVSPWLNELAEMNGIRSFNSSYISRIANDKRLSHSIMKRLRIPMLETLQITKQRLMENTPLPFPFVVKDPYGRGGTSVHFITNAAQLYETNTNLPNELIIQPVAKSPGKDVRVYVVGKQIVGAVLRESTNKDIRANISLGGQSSLYELSKKETAYIEQIIKHLKPDFVGLDFLFDEHGNVLFNEMEDAVGCRSLYMNSDIDIASIFMKYVASET